MGERAAFATFRYFKTQGCLEEDNAERLVYGGYGTVPKGGLWNHWFYPSEPVFAPHPKKSESGYLVRCDSDRHRGEV